MWPPPINTGGAVTLGLSVAPPSVGLENNRFVGAVDGDKPAPKMNSGWT